jgi:Cof subfamily protein (haloacid dehalogenase superfamily)
MYKLISLDLDGTLLSSSGKISKRNVESIKACHNSGIETVISTGRPPRFTIDQLPKEIVRDYVVCYNGARIYYQNKLIQETFLRTEVVKSLIDFLTEFEFGMEFEDQLYVNFDINKIIPSIAGRPMIELEAFHSINKVLIVNNDLFPMDHFLNQFAPYCKIFVTDSGRLIEIMDRTVSKANAIEWITRREGLNLNEVVAFGDDANDREIIESVGLGVAMANAIETLKQCADEVTLNNDEDGVAIILERILESNA